MARLGHRRCCRCRRSFIQNSVMNGKQRKFETIRNADLVIYVAEIILDDLLGRPQLRGDFFILVSLNDERDDAQFFCSQAIAHSQSRPYRSQSTRWARQYPAPNFRREPLFGRNRPKPRW